MAGKKKKGSSKKKSGNGPDPAEGMGISLPEDKIKYLEGQIQSLQFQLAQRSDVTASVSAQYEEMKKGLNEMNLKLEEEKQLSSAVKRDMTRQYKGMQEGLLNKINQNENSIQTLTDELHEEKKHSKKSLEEKDKIISEKDEHIQCLKDKMEDLCLNFANMIKDALDQMKERIEVQSACYDEKSVPIQHRLEEFKFNPNIQLKN
mmetsp:Transcript_18272/g.21127  ORF Transcript_18272/g.21127 Transcript_18272/m.21127 type:complete len:204 (-) Transcript_18272:6-617(-)